MGSVASAHSCERRQSWANRGYPPMQAEGDEGRGGFAAAAGVMERLRVLGSGGFWRGSGVWSGC